MSDIAALVSVVSSAAVALGGLLVTYRSGREQRTHERSVAFEERAWEAKSSALFDVIAVSRALIDTVTSSSEYRRGMLWSQVEPSLDRLTESLPLIETYASSECREAFEVLRDRLATALELLGAGRWVTEKRITDIRIAKENAIDAQDFDAASRLRDEERATAAFATAKLEIDVDDLRGLASQLIEAARDSLRGG